MVWLKFLFCVIVILIAGVKLARYGDAIAEKTGLGGMWIGLVLLAFVTSLPELVTGISSAVLVKIPDLAMGTLLGSCSFNILILVVLDIITRRAPILSKASRSNIMPGIFGIVLIGVAVVTVISGKGFSGLGLGWLGLSSIIIIIIYLLGIRQMFNSEKKKLTATEAQFLQYGHISVKEVYLNFSLAAAAIIGAGIWLAFVGDEIAVTTGWDTSFVGSLFLALTTSLPELAVTIAAVRIGATDMAVADLMGANMINIAKIFIIDLVYVEAPFLSKVSGVHCTTGLFAIGMTVVAILALVFRARRKTFIIFSWYTPLLVGLYIAGTYLLFTSGMAC